MRGNDIIFDKDKNRIGFVPSNCSRFERLENDEEDYKDDI